MTNLYCTVDDEVRKGLSDVDQRSLAALKELHSEFIDVKSKFFEEVHSLQCKYESQYRQLFDKRLQIISASVKPDESECQQPDKGEDDASASEVDQKSEGTTGNQEQNEECISLHGIPKFWLTVLRNGDVLSDLVQEYDEPILKHLQDIKVTLHDDPVPGFLLEFIFVPNSYFKNIVLTKEYTYSMKPVDEDSREYDGPEIVKCKGCTIDWNKGKNVTVQKVQKTVRCKNQNIKKTVVKTIEAPSFFNFFSPPQVPEGEEADPETDDILAADFEVGLFFKERIVPNAILYFTREALYDKYDEKLDSEGGSDLDDGSESDLDDRSDQQPSQFLVPMPACLRSNN